MDKTTAQRLLPDQEMRPDELRLPNEADSPSFILHPSRFMPALPGQLFYSTQIPVCLWSLAKNQHDGSVVVNESTLAA